MRSRVAILLTVAVAAIVCQSSAVNVHTRGEPGDRPGFAKPPSSEACQWYSKLCRIFSPCWYGRECRGYPDAECRPDLCACRAEYYNGDEKIDCQKVTDPDVPQVESVDVQSGQDCEPVRCRISCLDGYVKDSNGCDTCECVEPASRQGVCPDVGGIVGTCDIQCSSDAGCGEGEKCCSNGCGRACVPACSGILCRINCKPFGGFARDENGCEICGCVGLHTDSSNKVCPAIDVESGGICVIGCDAENECVNDGEMCCSNGCGKTCVKACEPVRCRMYCEHGFDTDEDGCEFCKCKVPPGCDEITCRMSCPYGFQRDDQGCEICRCFEPRKTFLRTGSRTTLPGVCPSVKATGGICVSTCSVDEDCTEDQKCCSNGCAMGCTQTCPALTCRMACPAGYVKDANGCDICRCRPPLRNSGKCPAATGGTFGICVDNCESDGDCEDRSMKCCSNGCAQTCQKACSPVMCRMGCKWGFAQDSEGCEICECLPTPADKPGECRVIDGEEQGGICVTECEDDSTCPSNKKCCSNGCGKTCTSACPIFKCRLGCHFGYVTDMNGCRTCECKPPPQDRLVDSEGCSLIRCRMFCEFGFKSDSNGCEICECNEEEVKAGICPFVSAEVGGICVESCGTDGECPDDQKCCSNGCGHVCIPACSKVQCRMYCRYGFLKDENGCGKCECADPPECEPLRCRLGCRNGYKKDERGCDICACRTFPNEFTPGRTGALGRGPGRVLPKVCPVVQQGVGGICVEGCDHGDNKCSEGQVCCSNGCGHVCTEGCEPVLCRMRCQYGWATDENNCEICACKDPPSACPEIPCQLDCPNGQAKDDNGCDICACAAPPLVLTCPTVTEGGICSELCGPSDPCGEGELCCSNGCGHVCKQGCRPVLCYLHCRHGWAKGEDGCDTCLCADPPLAVCPVVPKDVGGICVEQCGTNNKCDEGQLCCSNGCGHVCKAGCAPVVCRMRCQHGWDTDEKGCEICKCKQPVRVCPPLSDDAGGTCVEQCRSDNECDGGQMCCSNGCGHSCREGCPPVLCYLYCKHGWAKGENGCEICQCADPPIEPVCPVPSAESGGICVEQCDTNNNQCEDSQMCCSNGCGHVCLHGCAPVLCRMHCEDGWATDERGCEICECKKPASIEESPTCSPVMCLMYCEHGFLKNENGCDICQCAPAPELTCPVASGGGVCAEECSSDSECGLGGMCCSNGCGHSCKQGCAPVVCRMHCPYGWDTDEQGCQICQCKQPELQCPAPQEGVFGICVETCTPETQCGPGQKCCSNGCGHQCTPACPPLACPYTPCRYGRSTDVNGCETCDCSSPPEQCKPVRCRKICRYGFQMENGCEVCKCKRPSRELCKPVRCRMYCTYGFAENENGCEVCHCNPPPDVECRDGKIYQECGTACPMTCENVRSDELIGCPAICIQGCFCPPGSVLDSDGMCVKQRQCGCLYDADGNGQNEYYQLGDSFEIGVGHKDRCQCLRDGAVRCTRRKRVQHKQ